MLSFALIAAASGSCPVSNPNPDTMDQVFQQQWNSTKDDLDELTADNRGAQIFRDYVENCEHEGNQAFSSNELELQFAPTIGGTTMFYNNKSAREELDIFGGDLLVIPSQFFKVINDAQSKLGEEFNVLLRALVESGLTKVINDGEKGKNNWPTQNSVLMDSDGPGDRGYIYMCLHLDPNVSVKWMHLHIFQDDAWRNADSLWNQTNTCTRIQKPQGGRPWSTLLDRTKNNFAETVQNLADLLQCNMGDGHSGNVANFDAGSCPPNAVQSSEDYSEAENNTVESSVDSSEPEENPVESSGDSSEPEKNTIESSGDSSEPEESTIESSGDSSEASKSTPAPSQPTKSYHVGDVMI